MARIWNIYTRAVLKNSIYFKTVPMKTILLSFSLLLIMTGAFAQVQTAGSYMNISRPNGGPIQSGDILEIRAVIAVPSGTTVTAARFTDNVPAGDRKSVV